MIYLLILGSGIFTYLLFQNLFAAAYDRGFRVGYERGQRDMASRPPFWPVATDKEDSPHA